MTTSSIRTKTGVFCCKPLSGVVRTVRFRWVTQHRRVISSRRRTLHTPGNVACLHSSFHLDRVLCCAVATVIGTLLDRITDFHLDQKIRTRGVTFTTDLGQDGPCCKPLSPIQRQAHYPLGRPTKDQCFAPI